jgi:hypothetical protein
MKTVISVGIALALMLSVAPAMAGDTDMFQAFSKMAAGGEQELLTSLSDVQLAAVEGADYKYGGYGKYGYHKDYGDTCFYCSNTAKVTQANVNYGFASQSNSAYVRQSNN